MGGVSGTPPDRESAARLKPFESEGTRSTHPDAKCEQDPSFVSQVEAAHAEVGETLGQLLAEFRDYLLLVANREVDPKLQAKVAPSDLVQETLADALGKFQQFRGTTEAELRIWLARILKSRYSRAVTHYQRTQKRDVSREFPLAGSTSGSWPALEMISPEETPGVAAIAGENERLVRSAMGRLPSEYRRVIEMRNWQRLSFAAIGQQMNRSAEAVRKLWVRATERLGYELDSVDDSR